LTEEDRSSAYVRVDFASDESLRYSGNVGLRYVSYQLASTGASNFPAVLSDALIASDADRADGGLPPLNPKLPQDVIDYHNAAGGIAQTVKGEEFTRVLPSFNIKFELTDDLIARFAASEGIYLPELNDVRNQRGISGTNTTIQAPVLDGDGNPVIGSGGQPEEYLAGVVSNGFFANGAGNPYLQPEVSTNIDIALEWYFADFGSLTATVFDKKVDGYFRRATEAELVTNPVNNITQPVQSTKTINGGDAEVQGFELAGQTGLEFIAPALEDFGVQASYTYIDGETNDGRTPFDPTDSVQDTFRNFSGLPLEGLSQDNYNLVAFYDNGVFQTRFAYSWRSEYLLNSRDVIAFSPVYGEATGQLDWSAYYAINDNFKIGLEANNLLNEVTKTSIQYNQEGAKTPRSYFANDRRFGLFVQATF
jgi:TonB-dependent receptor